MDLAVDFVDSEKEYTKNSTIKTSIDLYDFEDLREKKHAFVNETIHLRLLDSNDNTIDGYSWKIKRFRLTASFVHDLVKRSLKCTDFDDRVISYLKSSDDGEILLLDEMQSRCRPGPVIYFLCLSNATRVKDECTKFGSYEGGMIFLLKNVPTHNEKRNCEVKSSDVRRWIIYEVIGQDITMKMLLNQKKSIEEKIRSLISQEIKTSTSAVLDKKGAIISNRKVADKERESKALVLNREKENAHRDRDIVCEKIRQTWKQRLQDMKIYVEKNQSFDFHHWSSWTIVFSGASKKYYESLMFEKKHWSSTMKVNPVLSNGDEFYEFSSLKDEYHANGNSSDTDSYIVDMSSISIEKVEHGFGNFSKKISESLHIQSISSYQNEQLPTNSNRIISFKNHVDNYIGTFINGFKEGNGMMALPSGVYCGEFHTDLPYGAGKMSFQDGDILTGCFKQNIREHHERKNCLRDYGDKVNRYARGFQNGTCKLSFADGGLYEGTIKDGAITGMGTYISANGDSQEGYFHNGVMIDGKITTENGQCSVEGPFRNGLLHGEQCIIVSHISKFEGRCIDGVKDGRGVEQFLKKTTDKCCGLNSFDGFFANGYRNTFAQLKFHHHQQGYAEIPITILYHGNFLAGLPTLGGVILNKSTLCGKPSHKMIPQEYKWFHDLHTAEERYLHHIKHYEQKEYFIKFRKVLEKKKKNIFQSSRKKIQQIYSDRSEDSIDVGSFVPTKNIQVDCDKKSMVLDKDPIRGTHDCDFALPTNSKYYKYRHVIHSPETLEEARISPGLRTEIRFPTKNGKQMTDQFLQIGLKDDCNCIQIRNVYDEMYQKWELINLEKLHQQIFKT